jgi:hypothetical protein
MVNPIEDGYMDQHALQLALNQDIGGLMKLTHSVHKDARPKRAITGRSD